MKDFNIYNQNENYSQIDYSNRQNSKKKILRDIVVKFRIMKMKTLMKMKTENLI